jgi:hypothetical protein
VNSKSGLFAEKKIFLSKLKIETLFLGCPARSLVTILTELLRLAINVSNDNLIFQQCFDCYLNLCGTVQWLRSARSKGPIWVGVSPPFTWRRKKNQLPKRRNFIFLYYIRAMDKVQKTIGSQCYTPSSEAFRIYLILWYCTFHLMMAGVRGRNML